MKFLRQDYFRYKRLKRKWRRPKGSQSKLRKGKSGSGLNVSIGYGKKKTAKPILIKNLGSLNDFEGNAIIISSQVGSKKTIAIASKAKKTGIKILNMKKVKRALKKEKTLVAKAEEKKAKKEEKSKEKKKEEKPVVEKEEKPSIEKKEEPTVMEKEKIEEEKSPESEKKRELKETNKGEKKKASKKNNKKQAPAKEKAENKDASVLVEGKREEEKGG